MVVILVVYDISDDRVRNAVARRLTSMGFIRIQKSAYVRRGTSGAARYVFRAVSRMIDKSSDKLLVIAVPDAVYAAASSVGRKGIEEPAKAVLV